MVDAAQSASADRSAGFPSRTRTARANMGIANTLVDRTNVANPRISPTMDAVRQEIASRPRPTRPRPNSSNARPTKIAADNGSENSQPEYAKIGVPNPTMIVANREAPDGIPIPASNKKKKVTVKAEKVALLRHEENATTRSVSSAGTPGNRANKYCPIAYQGAVKRACPGG